MFYLTYTHKQYRGHRGLLPCDSWI